jgi:flagellar basal body-associated protein FliL
MAEKAETKPQAPPAAAPAAPAGPPKESADHKSPGKKEGGAGLLSKTPVVMGIAMILEAAVLFAGFKFLGGGAKQASAVDLAKEIAEGKDGHGGGGGHGEEGGHGSPATGAARDKFVEINIVDFKAPNSQNGRRYIYDVSVFALVPGDADQKVKDKIKKSENTIKDRLRTIIAQMDPDKLGGGTEPGLETLRRQVKTQLEIIIGDGMIDEVLVPRCIPFRADF